MSHQDYLQKSGPKDQEPNPFQEDDDDLLDEHPFEVTFSAEKREPLRQNVINKKLVCYISSFQVSTSDWFSCYENIELFKDSLAEVWNSDTQTLELTKKAGLNAEKSFKLMFNIFLSKNFQAASPQEATLSKAYFGQGSSLPEK